MQTWGSEGDVQPFIALAAGLASAGHEVTLLATDIHRRDYSALAQKLGFAWLSVTSPDLPSPEGLEELGRKLFGTTNPMKQVELITQHLLEPARYAMFDAAQNLCRSNDVIVGHILIDPLRVAAEKAGVPLATISLAHNAIPSPHTRPYGFPKVGRWATPLWWKLAQAMMNRAFLPNVNALRERQGLAPDRDVLTQTWASERLNLIAVSPVLCELPSDWSTNHRVCGFLNLRVDQSVEETPPGLDEFIAGDEPPVYFTFGSMMPSNLDYIRGVADIWSSAVRLAACRAIFQFPWDDLSAVETDARVFKVKRSPHKTIFPNCALVVHHGGAGTTQTTLLAGRPSVVVAHLVDQFFWGSELERLGVAGPSQKRKGLSARRLAKSITKALNSREMLRRAASLGRAMAEEDGVKVAVSAIEAMVAGS
ncbi:MAG TPA: glycosyltransferase [Burkholderiaceae bacterium]|nr:glycosyltransferase [Burkholderiaceae bacterium]